MFTCVVPPAAQRMSVIGYVLRNVAFRIEARDPAELAVLLDQLERRRRGPSGRDAD